MVSESYPHAYWVAQQQALAEAEQVWRNTVRPDDSNSQLLLTEYTRRGAEIEWLHTDHGLQWLLNEQDAEVEWRVTWLRIVDGHRLSSQEYSEGQARKLARDIAAGIPQRYRDVRVQRRTVTPWADADEPEGQVAGSEETP